MTAVEIISALPLKGVGYIDREQSDVLLSEGAVAGKETTLEIPVSAGVRLITTIKLDLSYTKVWVRSRIFRAEVGRFALEGQSRAEAEKLLSQVDNMHYTDLLGEI